MTSMDNQGQSEVEICSIPECGRFADGGRGWCKKHYMRWYSRGGDPAEVLMYSYRSDDPAILRKRFDQKWRLDTATGCWQWISSTSKPWKQYDYSNGEFVLKGRKMKAHRMAWSIYRGEIPVGGYILHRCNNGLCVNPDHLYIGDHQQNMLDMMKSNRCGTSKLTPEQVLKIRASSEPTKILCARYNVTKYAINDIRANRTWRHIQDPPRSPPSPAPMMLP